MAFEPREMRACVYSIIVDCLLCTGSVPDTLGDAQMSHRWLCPQRAHLNNSRTRYRDSRKVFIKCSGSREKGKLFPSTERSLGGGRLGGKGGGTSRRI